VTAVSQPNEVRFLKLICQPFSLHVQKWVLDITFQWHDFWSLGLGHSSCVAPAIRPFLAMFLIIVMTEFKDHFLWEFSLHISRFTMKQFYCTCGFIRHQYFYNLVYKQKASHCVYLQFEEHLLFAWHNACQICPDGHNTT